MCEKQSCMMICHTINYTNTGVDICMGMVYADFMEIIVVSILCFVCFIFGYWVSLLVDEFRAKVKEEYIIDYSYDFQDDGRYWDATAYKNGKAVARISNAISKRRARKYLKQLISRDKVKW